MMVKNPVYKFVVTAEPVERRLPFTEKECEALAEYIRHAFELYGVETVIEYEEVTDGQADK